MASTNVRLIGGYQSKNAVATATATAAGYDPQNAVGLKRGSRWKGVGTSAQRLIIHTTAAIAPTALAIAAGNYSQWGTTKLQHGTDATTWTDFLTLSSLPSVDTLRDYYAALTSAPSKEWWALYWAAPSAAPEVGIFYLGAHTVLTYNPDIGMPNRYRFGVQSSDADDGSVVAETWARRRLGLDMKWSVVETAAKNQLGDFLDGEGGSARPFWFVPRDDAAAVAAGRAYLVRKQGVEFEHDEIFTDLWDMNLSILEEV
jgi:hypothetical protein